jgi:replicative DNA helicase
MSIDFPTTAPTTRPHSVADVLTNLNRSGTHMWRAAFRTGFEPLDTALEGGIRAQDLALIGGRPGVGKTIACLQWARNMALDGRTAIYVCYEHDEAVLLARLLALEVGALARPEEVTALDRVRMAIRDMTNGKRSMQDVVENEPLVVDAFDQVDHYADRMWLVRGGAQTDLNELRRLVDEHGEGDIVLIVDYLQKVAVWPEPASEESRVTRIAEGLKELALTQDVAVLAVAAADLMGISARRARLHHLRGSTALAYESDVVVMLNDKLKAVSKVHLAYDTTLADLFRRQVVFSVEKNRGGRSAVDVEFLKDFENYRFDPRGNWVTERLADEPLYEE